MRAALAAPMDFGEILEKKPRAVKECQRRSVVIGGKRPRYYLQNFHFQSGGWMTDDSASRYDTQVEVQRDRQCYAPAGVASAP